MSLLHPHEIYFEGYLATINNELEMSQKDNLAKVDE
jgi:hypothetical protein